MAGNIIHLIGFPGVGKLTIAKEIVRQSGFALVDNHLINNPIFSVIKADGKTRLPAGIWEKVSQIRAIVLDVISNYAPPSLSFVMTNVIINDEEDRAESKKIEDVAYRRGGLYFPVILTCDIEENKKRIVSEERARNLKSMDPSEPDRMHAGPGLIDHSGHPCLIKLDVTHITPADSARLILDEVQRKLLMEQKNESHRPHHP